MIKRQGALSQDQRECALRPAPLWLAKFTRAASMTASAYSSIAPPRINRTVVGETAGAPDRSSRSESAHAGNAARNAVTTASTAEAVRICLLDQPMRQRIAISLLRLLADSNAAATSASAATLTAQRRSRTFAPFTPPAMVTAA